MKEREYVVLSKFRVANGMTAQVAEAFENRPHRVEDHAGFLRLEVICPEDEPDEFWLLTYWESRETFQAWHHGHAYRDSHAGIPKGLKLVPAATQLRFFTLIAD